MGMEMGKTNMINSSEFALIRRCWDEIRYSLSCGDQHGKPYVFLFELDDKRVREVAEIVIDNNKADHVRNAIRQAERHCEAPIMTIAFDRQTADRIIGHFGVRTPWVDRPVWNVTFPVVVLTNGRVHPFALGCKPLEGDGDNEPGMIIDPILGSGDERTN